MAHGGRFRPHNLFLGSSENCLKSLQECVPLLNHIQLLPLLFVVNAGRRNYGNLEAPFFLLLFAHVCEMCDECVHVSVHVYICTKVIVVVGD